MTEVCEAERKLAREIKQTDWSTAGNLSNRSPGVQIPRDISIRFGRYLYSTKCSWIIKQLNEWQKNVKTNECKANKGSNTS